MSEVMMMTEAQRNIASFLVRFTQDLWQDENGEPRVQWRGHIRHVQDDEEARFTDFTEVVTFIQQHLTQLTLDALEGGKMDQEKTLHESFKLWEQFTSSYMDMMFKGMEQTLKQSEAMREQMDSAVRQALSSWGLPAQADQGEIVEALNKLQKQVQALSRKVGRLEKSLQQEE
jgi:hypothetical protein